MIQYLMMGRCCRVKKRKTFVVIQIKTSAYDIEFAMRENVHASYNNKQDDDDDASEVENLFDFSYKT